MGFAAGQWTPPVSPPDRVLERALAVLRGTIRP